jgi:hypothetical protein
MAVCADRKCLQVKIFSRRCEDKTGMFPDVVEAILDACEHPTRRGAAVHGRSPRTSPPPTLTLIADAELVAVDRSNGNGFRAFQELSTRARDSVATEDVSVAVCVFLFDLLFLNGNSILTQPLRERRELLRTIFPGLKPGFVSIAQGLELCVKGELPPAPQARQALATAEQVGSLQAVTPCLTLPEGHSAAKHGRVIAEQNIAAICRFEYNGYRNPAELPGTTAAGQETDTDTGKAQTTRMAETNSDDLSCSSQAEDSEPMAEGKGLRTPHGAVYARVASDTSHAPSQSGQKVREGPIAGAVAGAGGRGAAAVVEELNKEACKQQLFEADSREALAMSSQVCGACGLSCSRESEGLGQPLEVQVSS